MTPPIKAPYSCVFTLSMSYEVQHIHIALLFSSKALRQKNILRVVGALMNYGL
jgi:hypothetical protein